MKATKHLFLAALALSALTAGGWAQTETASNAAAEKPNPAGTAPAPQPVITAADIQALKDALAAQQRQIQALQEQLQQQDKNRNQDNDRNNGQATPPLPAAQQTAPVPASLAPAAQQLAEVKEGIVPQDQQQNATSGLNLQDAQNPPSTNPMESPVLSIHFRGITITPGGFAEAAFVRRSRALGADLTTPFNSLTMPGAAQNQLSEFFGSARQSRPTIYIDGRMKNVEFSSYVSGDFLSAGVTSTATQTNSYTFRLRQAWGQAKFDNGWSILGGQMWSLVTENKGALGPSDDTGRANDARPMTIDPGYNVGFTFARQYALRVTKDFGDRVWVAVSMENPQATLTTHGNANNYVLGEAGASNSYNTTSNYSFNPSPDVIAKLAFEPGFGHYEIFGLFDRFRDRVYPCVESYTGSAGAVVSAACPAATDAGTAAAAFDSSRNGGAFGANARWTFADKHVVFGLHGFGGSGVGRYGAGQLSDVAIKADGAIALIKGYQSLATLEWHGKKLDLYFYTGAEYASRTADFDPLGNKGAGTSVGYGAPGFNNFGCYTETIPGASGSNTTAGFEPGALANCTADTKVLIEGTGGFWYRFYNGPRGKFQFGTQYSYVTRDAWSGDGGLPAGTPGSEPHGLDNMIFTSLRYYLP
jgi:hypothetical protein